MSKILFYRNDFGENIHRQLEDGWGGVGYYRIIKPFEYLKGHVKEMIGIKMQSKKWADIFKEYDVLWCSYFSDPHQASQMFYHRDLYKKKIIIDLDDNYLDILPSHHLYDRFKPTKKERAFLSTIISFADAITVSTEPLRQKIDSHLRKVYGLEKKIFVIPNMNEIKEWNFKPVEKDPNKIVIGYAGSNSHTEDLKMFLPSLGKIMDKYPNVYFEISGSIGKHNADELFKGFSDSAISRCDAVPSTWGFKEYPEHLSKMKWDIGVAPLIDDAFTVCKSHIKWLEYSMYKIPTIASRVYPYFVPNFDRETITDEVNGLLVKPSEWFDALERLIIDKSFREELGSNAYDDIKTHWQYGEAFSNALEEVVKSL